MRYLVEARSEDGTAGDDYPVHAVSEEAAAAAYRAAFTPHDLPVVTVRLA